MLHCALAEWQLARTRLIRSRLGLWLVLLVGGVVLVARHPVVMAVDVGMLAAVLAVAFIAGADSDRAALTLTLTHPTSPVAVALGRWLAASAVAAICVGIACGARAGLGQSETLGLWRAAAGGVAAAGATAGCTLALVWAGGNGFAGVFFLYVFAVSRFGPPALAALIGERLPGTIVRAVVETFPAVWRYARLAGGDTAAWLHATGWATAGVTVAALVLARRSRL